MRNLLASLPFAERCSALNTLRRGKSTSSITRLALAKAANSGLSNTSLFNLMHQPHQSEPVKSMSTSLFSDLAWLSAALKSVNQFNSARQVAAANAAMKIAVRRDREFILNLSASLHRQ